MENSRIVGCNTLTNGGGIFLNEATASIFNSGLQNNHADTEGWCISAAYARLTMANSRMVVCSRLIAGGISLDWATASIYNSALQNNHAEQHGGCIAASRGSQLVATNTTFEFF